MLPRPGRDTDSVSFVVHERHVQVVVEDKGMQVRVIRNAVALDDRLESANREQHAIPAAKGPAGRTCDMELPSAAPGGGGHHSKSARAALGCWPRCSPRRCA